MFPPKSNNVESDIAVESRRNTEFTFTFSLNTSQGNGILPSLPLTELWKRQIATRLSYVMYSHQLKSTNNMIANHDAQNQ
jgi:hypothetical protein